MAALRTAILKRLTQSIMTVSRDPWAAAGVAPLLPSMCAALESHGFSSLVRCVGVRSDRGAIAIARERMRPAALAPCGLLCFRAVAATKTRRFRAVSPTLLSWCSKRAALIERLYTDDI
jgi:hypothetical protein